ncbi:Elongation of fatty acids protein 2 [Mycoemilia scoparia]|uniref:Flap endonuclease 1 n=1 Tax=Mycoemilia scoparia TaxID=417184 RepID=A0A9W8A2D1_9FUNG|nr:Elongation of fatty acids protein 2 [Mycoemilia scoparia]
MGIHSLTKVIGDNAASALKSNDIKTYVGRKVAIDASMSIYQFLIAVRGQDGQNLTNEAGETTSHLIGMFYRTIRMVENGIKPVYVFDGKPPLLKSGELAKRLDRRVEAEKNLEAAKEAGDTELIDKMTRRTVRVSKEHNEECKRLLELMGIPIVNAPCEAEAQCAALAKSGKVWAAASEDMDTLCFGTPILLRHLTFSEARKMPIDEFHLDKVLDGLGLSQDEFIDLCIMLGCDYTGTIKGVGPKTATSLIQKHKTIEQVIKNLKESQTVPEEWNYAEVRKLFTHPEVLDPSEVDLKWSPPNEEGLRQFLVDEKGFNEDRIAKGIEKLKKGAKTATQGRLDSFFKPMSGKSNGTKRKADKKPGTSDSTSKKAKSGSKRTKTK